MNLASPGGQNQTVPDPEHVYKGYGSRSGFMNKKKKSPVLEIAAGPGIGFFTIMSTFCTK